MDTIKNLRKIIDEIDSQILDLIKSRIEVVVEIGEAKKQNNIDVIDEKREQEIYDRLIEKAKQKGVKPELVKKVWKLLLETSYDIERGKNGNS